MDQKLKEIDKYITRLHAIASRSSKAGKLDKALAAIGAVSSIQYSINQTYTDDLAEEILKYNSAQIKLPNEYCVNDDTVLFYDGFGLDLRGWAASFVKGIVDAGFTIIYITKEDAKGHIPHIEHEVGKGKGRIEYVNINHSYITSASILNSFFLQYRPKTAFLYTYPSDVSAVLVFDAYDGLVQRIQIDLTDHAFWLGSKAFDYITESRILGASNAVYHRGVSKEKIQKMDCCLYINSDMDEAPLPFDIYSEKYIFSGGALYKTLGDKEHLYYKIIDIVLNNNKDVRFLYAGNGDDTELKKLIDSYPDRAFHIPERPDFYRLFENCLFFLNTYPMFGGLMMRFAANAGKIPLTLKHDSDHSGILIGQDTLGITFDTLEEIVAEANRLIRDEDYRRSKESKLKSAVLSQSEFAVILRRLITEGNTGDSFMDIPEIETLEFRKEYLNRLDIDELLLKAIPTKLNKSLLASFPRLFIQKAVRRIKHDKF